MAKLPPPGVSSQDAHGNHKAITGAPRRRKPGEDVLMNPEKYRVVESANPPGTTGIRRDIREAPILTSKSPRHTATIQSVDGSTYTFRTHDTKGKSLEFRNQMCLFIAMREVSLGGSALPVFQAFKVSIRDMDGKRFFPVPEDLMVVPDNVESPLFDDSEYSLGE